MSDRDIEVSIEVVSRSEEKVINRSELEKRLYTILANHEHGSDEYEAIADTLALLLQIKGIAGQKGKSTEKGLEILKHSDLSNAKHSLKEHRDQLACALDDSRSSLICVFVKHVIAPHTTNLACLYVTGIHAYAIRVRAINCMCNSTIWAVGLFGYCVASC